MPYCERLGLQPFTLNGLREFETVDPALVQGMTGEERKPIVDAYWAQSDIHHRMGDGAETFHEFAQRVTSFKALSLPQMPDGAVVFGHGMWIAMLCWQSFGFAADDGLGMTAFRRFQLGFPMPNGAVYKLTEFAPDRWTVVADEAIFRLMVDLAASN